jgi:hypothetical protein
MQMAILIVILLLEIVGVFCCLVALRYRTDRHPGIISFNPRNWIPVWKMQPWFSPRGYWLNLCGIRLIVLSSIAALIFVW